jgi:hypothetical protein
MVRKLCLRWNKLLQFFRLKPYKTAEFKVAVPKTEVLEQPHLIKKNQIDII